MTRRNWLKTAGAAAIAGSAAGFGRVAALIAKKYGLVPPGYHSPFGAGESLTYAAHRVLLSGSQLAREFRRDQISANFPAINTVLPEDPWYRREMQHAFREWTLDVDGLVDRPGSFSLRDLKRYPSRSQITMHVCEQGWSAIAEWTGVPLSVILDAVGIKPEAKYVVFYAVDDWWDSLDMADARHPQTLLAYGMNGKDLPVPHGAPVRLRVERQLGYKNLKYVSQISVVDSLKDIGKGGGAVGVEMGYSWYAGI